MQTGQPYSSFRIQPATAALGAYVEGIDLKAPLEEKAQEELRAALAEHLVLFFLDQYIDDDAQLALADCFGGAEVHPIRGALGDPSRLHDIVDTPESVPDRDGWHTDVTYMERPPAAAILRCEETPEAGGDTLWANMQLAYDKLSDSMKAYIDGLEGFHATDGGFIEYINRHLPAEAVEKIMNHVGHGVHHPIVRTHAVTGKKALFVDQSYLSRIEGLPKDESRYLLDFLSSRCNDVSIQCRFQWREGAVAIWDEAATQHSGSADHRGASRILRRCTIEGERPV